MKVTLADGISYDAELCAHDFHLNFAAIKFASDDVVRCAPRKRLDDSIHLNPSQCLATPVLVRNSSLVSISPGDPIVVIGRHFASPYDLRAASGVLR